MGFAINDARNGEEELSDVKALKDFGGRSVLEMVDNYDGDTYRAVHTVRFASDLYPSLLQKQSTKGAETPKRDIEAIKPA
ncbi:type II toxin-antitoxin system RelE/ParE family toxin [Rhizobium sullae]|uniref:type II toxin-antitoxin system RelE/ParE family toxin n=1 Tax=Rhizobium sullae TaxID=50338 RepID=UPI001FCD9056|nr:type II toxin-antitoxin system RelE/ParE family toxin [Rhizobium sullae]